MKQRFGAYKKFFTAIRQWDLALVEEFLAKKTELVSARAKQPPKKDDGQSPLQVALKISAFDIANLLLDKGADVNFIEADDCYNEWRSPVLHDAIRCAVNNTRWNVNWEIGNRGLEVHHTQEEAEAAYDLLKRLLDKGADVQARDSFGNHAVDVLVGETNQILPTYRWQTKEVLHDRLVTPELQSDLQRIFELLISYGMDTEVVHPNLNNSSKHFYQDYPVAQIFR